MWGLKEINIDSTANLVSLRADWHALYDADCWTFVPSQTVLKKMIKMGIKGTFQTPFIGFTKTKIDYEFVPFRTLALRFIPRDQPDHENFDTYWIHNNFADFPVLKHHSHPYFVIANALPKFQLHADTLTPKQLEISISMQKILVFWRTKMQGSSSQSILGKRQQDEGPSDDEYGHGSTKPTSKRKKEGQHSRPTNKSPIETHATGKGKGRQHKQTRDTEKTSRPLLQTPYPSPPRTASRSHTVADYNEKSVLVWIHNVTAAGPMEMVTENILESDSEKPRKPFGGDWHDWCYPWTQPLQASSFSSNDWAMHHHLCKLTDEPGGWAVAL